MTNAMHDPGLNPGPRGKLFPFPIKNISETIDKI